MKHPYIEHIIEPVILELRDIQDLNSCSYVKPFLGGIHKMSESPIEKYLDMFHEILIVMLNNKELWHYDWRDTQKKRGFFLLVPENFQYIPPGQEISYLRNNTVERFRLKQYFFMWVLCIESAEVYQNFFMPAFIKNLVKIWKTRIYDII